jgi:hypothetical protein
MLSGLAGAISFFLLGRVLGWVGKTEQLRKGLLEGASGALAGSALSFLAAAGLLPLAAVTTGAGISLGLQGLRSLFSRNIERLSRRYRNLWDGVEAARTAEIRRLAFRRPALLWYRFLHVFGFTTLHKEAIQECQVLRAEIAGLPGVRPETWTLFHLWWRDRAKPLLLIFLVGTLLQIFAFFFCRDFMSLFQAGLIALLVFYLPDPLTQGRKPEASAAVRQLCKHWWWFWTSFIALYLVFFLQAMMKWDLQWILPTAGAAPIPAWSVARNFLNNISTFLLVVCYAILNNVVVATDVDVLNENYTPLRLPLLRVIGLLSVVVFTVSELLYHSYGQSLAMYDRHLFSWVSGFIGGVALALLVGRLQSKYLAPSMALVAALYAYAVIQGAMGAFEIRPLLQISLLTFAFGLKCLLFMFVAWMLESGVLLFYIDELRNVTKDRETKMKEFFRQDGGHH